MILGLRPSVLNRFVGMLASTVSVDSSADNVETLPFYKT
jgi:hypothetical protein